jgi:hypothetical protein
MFATRVPNLDGWETQQGHPRLDAVQLAHESDEWRAAAARSELYLLAQ